LPKAVRVQITHIDSFFLINTRAHEGLLRLSIDKMGEFQAPI